MSSQTFWMACEGTGQGYGLGEVTEQKIEDMPIVYDIEQDYLYKQGIKKKTIQVIQVMLKDSSLTIEQIAKFTETSVEYVEEVRKGLK